MLSFLQGFAYGLFLSCLPWFVAGMADPRLAVASEPARRWEVIVRYWFLVPFIAFLLWLTSLWGGFGPSLAGWLAGLAAVAVELPLERRWRRWHSARAARHRAATAHQRREAGVASLDPAHPPPDADDVVLELCSAKQQLLDAGRPDLAVQADRLYTRYAHVLRTLRDRFHPGEVTMDRAHGLVADVCRGGVDTLIRMASAARGVAGIDAAYVHRRLKDDTSRLSTEEREALAARLSLVEETDRRLRTLSTRNEAAMTALDHAAVAIARIETGRPRASMAADQALAELRRFVDRAELYNRKP